MGASPQDIVALLGGHREVALPLGVGGGQADPPVAVVGDVHLPVVAAAVVALPAQHAGQAVESLGALWGLRLRQALLHPALVV